MAPPSPLLRTATGVVALLGMSALGAWSLIDPGPPPPASTASPGAAPAAAATASPALAELTGLCEASALLADGDGWLVGDNEARTVLFQRDADLAPRGELQLDAEVDDIEALARLPDGAVVVVASQGTNKKGERKKLRERILVLGADPVTPDLSGCAPCVEATGRPPKEGGLSVEGAAWWRGALWLGLRSPLPQDHALLLRMVGDPREELSVGEVHELDLAGEGIRDLTVDGDRLLILAGPSGKGSRPHRLYTLAEPSAQAVQLAADLPPDAEGLGVHGDELVLVTDGAGEPGHRCTEPARWGRRALPR